MKSIENKQISMAFRLSITLALLYSASVNLYAAEDFRYWQRIGPKGSHINHFVTSQKQPDIIYASSKSHGGAKGRYYKSINSGLSWVALPDVPNSISYTPYNIATNLTVDSGNPNILYAYSLGGLVKSTDNALHWQLLGSDVNMDAASFFALNPFVTQSLRVLTKTENRSQFGMATSDDAGQKWIITSDRLNLVSAENNAEILLETSDAHNPDILYGVSYTGGGFGVPIYPPLPEILYRSIDGGLDWINITPSGKAYSGKSLIMTDNGTTLYATFATSEWGGEEQTLVSHNGGVDWESLGTPRENLVDFKIFKAYADPTDGQILYANVYPVKREDRSTYPNRIAKSYNAGDTWQLIDTSPYLPGQIAVHADNKQWLLMSSEQGVLRSENGGVNWTPSNTGMQELGGSLAVARNDNATMYAAIDPRGSEHYKSIDAGLHWESFTTKDPVEGDCVKFLLNPKDSKEIICQSYSSLYRSKDAGDHWELFKFGRQAVYANDGKTIYVYTGHGLISKTIDSGQSWYYVTRIIDKLDPDSATYRQIIPFSELPIIDPVNQNIIYAMVYIDHSRRLYKSIDHGRHWQLLVENSLSGTRKLLIHPLNPARLIYMMGNEKSLLSDDGGENWQEISLKLEAVNYSVTDLIFDPNDSQGLYWAVTGGVYHSKDMGVSWTFIDKGLSATGNLELISGDKDMFVSSEAGIFKLSEKAGIDVTLDCLFQWAETNYPELFSPGASNSQQWGGYTYRYYQESNAYLGFFYEQEVHLNRANLSSKIEALGTVDLYQKLSSCP